LKSDRSAALGKIAPRLFFDIRTMRYLFDSAPTEVLLANVFQHFLALIVKPFRLPPGRATKRVCSDQRKTDCRIAVAHDTIRQALRIYLAPTHCFARSRPAQTSSVRARIRTLQKIVVTTFFDPHYLLNLRLRLKHEILGRTPAHDEDA